jgi:hypothetical protein
MSYEIKKKKDRSLHRQNNKQTNHDINELNKLVI